MWLALRIRTINKSIAVEKSSYILDSDSKIHEKSFWYLKLENKENLSKTFKALMILTKGYFLLNLK